MAQPASPAVTAAAGSASQNDHSSFNASRAEV